MRKRLNEDIIYLCECKECSYISKAWALETLENNTIKRIPNISICPICNKPLKYKLIERLLNV